MMHRMKNHWIDFTWYGLGIVIAVIAIVAEMTGTMGPISGPMLWTLFGLATSRIVVKGKWIHSAHKTFRKEMNHEPQRQGNVFGISGVYNSEGVGERGRSNED